MQSSHLFGTACDNIQQCPMVARQHAGAEAINVIGSVAAEYIRQLDHGALKIIHQLIDGFYGHGLCFFSQMRVDAFQNPEFYRAQAMRFSTYGKNRIISCCEDFPKHIGLPRGCLEGVVELLSDLKIKPEIIDKRLVGKPIRLNFMGIWTNACAEGSRG
jgi:hypothetical protein